MLAPEILNLNLMLKILKKFVNILFQMLSKNCEYEIEEIIKEAALDYQQDPILAKACHQEVKISVSTVFNI